MLIRSFTAWLAACTPLFAGIGDPQIRTDHPWYPGELACSTFPRLFATQAEQYERMTGIVPKTEHDKALASWAWRNTHLAHGEEGAEDLWGQGFTKGDLRTREYWTGLFAHGFAPCGTTHSQWTAEMEELLGHGRGRGLGVKGHNAFEVFLTGNGYGSGRWALLDHDLSTVIFDPAGKTLLSLRDISSNWKQLTDRQFLPQKQQGWLVCGLHPGDGASYAEYKTAEYLAGYSAAPPMVHLRQGEKLRRYFAPGLEDGKTYVFWGRNYRSGGIPGPERAQTWVNQPEAMHGSKTGTPHKPGQARYGNAVYTYTPDFASTAYREGVVSEDDRSVTFEFLTPYIIASTPANDQPWGIYEAGGRNGLILRGKAQCSVAISLDRGATWKECGVFRDGLDLTDHAKSFRQYQLRFGAAAKDLAGSGLTIRTVCQLNAAILPRLKDNGTRVDFSASHRAMQSAGPTRPQAQAHIIAGKFDSPTVTLALNSPRNTPITAIYAHAQVASGNPPNRDVKHQIEYSIDNGATWTPIVKDWAYPQHGDDPPDFWSQSFCYGKAETTAPRSTQVQVRFSNNGRRNILRAAVDVLHEVPTRSATKVTYRWRENGALKTATHTFPADSATPWMIPTGSGVLTESVEFEPVVK